MSATPLVAAGALFVDDAGRVLLVRPTYKPGWEVPGGRVERGESPAAACRRELREELGLDRAPLRLLSVDWAPNDADGDGDKLLFLFDCGKLGDDEHRITLGADELDRWAWVAPRELGAYLRPPLARRVTTTLAGGSGPYLELGVRPAGFED